MWSSKLGHMEFKTGSHGVQNWVMWSSKLGHLEFKTVSCGLQNWVIWCLKLGHMKCKTGSYGVQNWVMWSPKLGHEESKTGSCGVQNWVMWSYCDYEISCQQKAPFKVLGHGILAHDFFDHCDLDLDPAQPEHGFCTSP